MNCKEIKEIVKIDEYLAGMGIQPSKITAAGLWYISPISGEDNPSFEVSLDGRKFHDWSSDCSGTIIDLYMAIHPGSSIHDAIIGLSTECSYFSSRTSLHATRVHANKVYNSGLIVESSRKEISRNLQGYAFGRGITREVLLQYCVQVDYINAGRRWYGIGFQNDKGGYEIRSHAFKGGSSPKGITTVGFPRACPYLVFEGFFDFLSAVQFGWFKPATNNAVILNSTSMIKDGIAALQSASRIVCFLDNDTAGKATFKRLATAYPGAEDYSFSFSPANDLNEYICKFSMNNSKIRARK